MLSVVAYHAGKTLSKSALCRALLSVQFSTSSDKFPGDWRKKQLEHLENSLADNKIVQSEEDLQPMWKSMENRVKGRRPRTANETGGKTGRTNVKQSEEDVWLEAGLYDNLKDDK
jgi:hypothetical protein